MPPTLYVMSPSDRGGTLLFFPDFGGNTLYARPIVQNLSKNVTCIGVRFSPEMINSLEQSTIGVIANCFAEDIERANFNRPIHLLGFSFAAILAYETARAMTDRGVPPDDVWILDQPPSVTLSIMDILRDPVLHLRSTYRQIRKNWRSMIFGIHDPMILQRYGVIGFDLRAHPESYRYIIRQLYAAYSRYLTQPVVQRVTLLIASNNRSKRKVSNDLGWQAFSVEPVNSIIVPGDHLSMLRSSDNAAVVANLISARFARQTVEESNDQS